MLKFWFAIPLWQRVVAALVLGIATGLFWGPGAESIKWMGDFFIASIKMLVVPLIFFSLVSGVASIGDLRKLGKVGGRAIVLFLITGQIAVWLGLGLGTIFLPGAGLDTSAIQTGDVPQSNFTGWTDMIVATVPASPVQVMADGAVLATGLRRAGFVAPVTGPGFTALTVIDAQGQAVRAGIDLR